MIKDSIRYGVASLGLLCICCFCGVSGVWAQEVQEVRGIVLDSVEQTPLVGAAVVALKPGTTDEFVGGGTISDLDGRFVLEVPAGTTHVIVQYVGYESMVLPWTGEFLTVRMLESMTEIEGVIVTGYGNIDRRKSTASVSNIMVEAKPKPTMGVDHMLQGQLAGVMVQTGSGAPGAPAKIRIRGTSSLQGTQDPLWVLDGMPLEGTDLPKLEELASIDQLYSSSIAGVNAEDIKSISVLRDAAATAIYGARAANGVIVINTKQGRQGDLRVNYVGKVSVSERPNIKRLNLLSSDEKVDLELALLRSDYTYQKNKGEVSRILKRWGDLDYYALEGDESLSPESRRSLDSLRSIHHDWNAELFRIALSHDHYLSISGGGRVANYFVSMGYYDEYGTTRGVRASRYNLTAKTHFNFWDRVKLGVSVFANERRNQSYLSTTSGFTNPVFYARRANPYLQTRDAAGNYLYDQDMQGYGRDGVTIPFNMLEEMETTRNRLKNQSVTTLFDLNVRIGWGLSLNSQAGLQYDGRKGITHAAEESYATRADRKKAEVRGKESYLPEGGVLKNNDGHAFQYTIKNMLQYSQLFAEIHDFELMVGNEIRRAKDENVFSAAYGYDEATLHSQPIIYPDATYARVFPLFRRNVYENAFVSFFSTASYTLLSRYTLGASIRFDGSNLFGVDARYRYLPLYSVSVMWDLTREPWLEPVKWMSELRLRASYGLQGNIDKSTSVALKGEWKERASILPGGDEKNIYVSMPPNPRLRWEKTASYNVGIDWAVLNSAYRLSVDGYYRKSSDLIGMQRLPLETGFEYNTVNWSSLTNAGVEVNLSLLLLKIREFTWDMQVNCSYNYNRIDRLTVRNDSRVPSGEGYPVGGIFTLPYVGIDAEGYPLYEGAGGKKVRLTELMALYKMGPSVGSRLSPAEERALYQYQGTDEPPFSGGLTTSWRWRGWTLSMAAVANLGHKFLVQPYYNFTRYDRGLNTSDYILERWSEENPSGSLPRLMSAEGEPLEYQAYDEMGYAERMSLWVRKAGYVRLQSIRLMYELEERWVQAMRLKSVTFTFEARNVAVYGVDYKGFLDPETMKNPFAQPIPRTYTFGVSVGF